MLSLSVPFFPGFLVLPPRICSEKYISISVRAYFVAPELVRVEALRSVVVAGSDELGVVGASWVVDGAG